MYKNYSLSLISLSIILSAIFILSNNFNKNHNLFFNKLSPSTWLNEYLNLNEQKNKFEIIYNSRIVSKNIPQYQKIYNYLTISEYDQISQLSNPELIELF